MTSAQQRVTRPMAVPNRGVRRWEKLLGRPPRMLVVEDDPGILTSVLNWFEYDGWEVKGADDGSAFFKFVEDAIVEHSEELYFDLIITDICMPGLDVLAILEGLRVSGNPTPFVVISALPDPQLPRRVADLGGAQFFRKPFQLSKINQTVRRLLMASLDDKTIH